MQEDRSAMTMLLFNHGGWEILTAAWTASAKQGEQIEIRYQWGGDWSRDITGVARTTLNLTMAEFSRLAAAGGVVDLRSYSS